MVCKGRCACPCQRLGAIGSHLDAPTRQLILILATCGFASTFAIRVVDPLIGVIARDLRSDPHTIALLATAFASPTPSSSRSSGRSATRSARSA